MAMSREAVLCVTVQGGGIWWIEAKDASKHSTMHRTALHHTDDHVQVEKL